MGFALFGLGLVAAVAPEAAALLPAGALAAAVGSDYLLGAALAVVATVGALAVAVDRTAAGFDQATLPPVGTAPRGHRPGETVDAALAGEFGAWDHLRGRRRARVRRRLRRAAVGAVARTEHCPREEARRRVSTGEWTDDTVAARFLAGEPEADLLDRALDAVPGRSRFAHRTRRAVTAVLAHDREGSP